METQQTLARLEERLEAVYHRLASLEKTLLNGISEKLHDLDRRVSLLERDQAHWLKWGDVAFKVAATVVAAFVCWKLGFPH
jgi:hypothetical protein